MDDLKDIDFAPLIDVCMNLDTSEIEVVDVRNETPCVLNGEYALSLMHAINQKLRVVELLDVSFGKDFLRYITVLFIVIFVEMKYFLIVNNLYSHLAFNLREFHVQTNQ